MDNAVCRRVRDDEVAIIANTFSIREIDMKDKKNFIYSPTLVSYAIKRGWYSQTRQETVFAGCDDSFQ